MLNDCLLVEEIKKQHQKNQFVLNIFNFAKFEKKPKTLTQNDKPRNF